MASQQFCLKWNNHLNNMIDVFKSLYSSEAMVDVTLACDGLSLKAHKVVLSACSPFFQSLFLENPCQHPIVILKDIRYRELKAILEFMYHGEVNVAQEQLSSLMKTAETLRVKGLAENTSDDRSSDSTSSKRNDQRSARDNTPPPAKRKRGRVRKRSASDHSDYSDDEPKIKQHSSSDYDAAGDMDNSRSNSSFSNLQSQVPVQSSRSSNAYRKSSAPPQVDEPPSADEGEFGMEPAKLMEQTLTTNELNTRRGRRSTSSDVQRTRSSTDASMSQSLVPVMEDPHSSLDVKPALCDIETIDPDPVSSPGGGGDQSNMDDSMLYMDQSSMSSVPGTSGYQESSALVPADGESQGNI